MRNNLDDVFFVVNDEHVNVGRIRGGSHGYGKLHE
jgi:hypothetical protein